MNYRPYSPEWHRKRFLKEALEKYLDEDIGNHIIMQDIRNILHERSESAYSEFQRINQLEHYLSEE
jgi:hypothetical protein